MRPQAKDATALNEQSEHSQHDPTSINSESESGQPNYQTPPAVIVMAALRIEVFVTAR